MDSKLFTKVVLATVLSLGMSSLASAQTPGNPGVQDNKTGIPNADADLGKKAGNATVIYANSDGENDQNQFIYFKVYKPGGGSKRDWDWYTNPTAWMGWSDFNLYHADLKMYDNIIRYNNAPKSRRIVFDQDTWATDDYQFTGFGSTNNNDLRYQIKDATKSHVFYAGMGSTSAKTLMTVNGNGRLQLPKAGQLEVGSDDTKEKNAGTISYKMFSDGLDIVGAGTAWNNRIVKVWAENGTSFNGLVSIGSDKNWFHTVPPTKLAGGVSLSTYKLFVDGGVLAKEVRVNSQWADYVFKSDYRLRTLSEVEDQIQKLGHLPGMPSANEVEQNGLDVATTLKLQQEKIEELTLYIIDLKKMMDKMQAQISISTTPASK